MNIKQLKRKFIEMIKQDYLVYLASIGVFGKVVGRGYNSLGWNDFVNADEIVPDNVVFAAYRNYKFDEQNFCLPMF